jgi:hypothetical protein
MSQNVADTIENCAKMCIVWQPASLHPPVMDDGKRSGQGGHTRSEASASQVRPWTTGDYHFVRSKRITITLTNALSYELEDQNENRCNVLYSVCNTNRSKLIKRQYDSLQ